MLVPGVVAIGPVGHIYLDNRRTDKGDAQVISDALVQQHEVPAVVEVTEGNRLLVYTRRALFELPEQEKEVFGKEHPFLSVIGADLLRVCQHADAGDNRMSSIFLMLSSVRG